jgi:hypothetical protein
MDGTTWVSGPFDIDAEHRVTRPDCRSVLVMVPTVTAGHRLLDLISLLESDPRVQVVFSVPHTTGRSVGPEEFVRRQHGLLLPWAQVVQHRYDLVLSASHRELASARGNVMVLPHGASSTMSRSHSRKAAGATMATTGLDRDLLTYRGRVIPKVVALTHDDECRVLRERCPEASATAIVAGDVCLDRMRVSLPLRERYRRALGVADDQTLVTVNSTWSTESTFGRRPDLFRRLLGELPPDRYQVGAILHPNIWAAHGQWQVRAWLADCLRAGLLLIPPEEGWQATVIGSDWIIGDHGSTTAYGAAIGRPVSLAAFPDHGIRAGSIADRLASAAVRLDHGRALLPQLRAVSAASTAESAALCGAITSRPGQSAAILRAAMYRLLSLAEPSAPAVLPPLPDPRPIRPAGGASR